jgi:hypothetical protein
MTRSFATDDDRGNPCRVPVSRIGFFSSFSGSPRDYAVELSRLLLQHRHHPVRRWLARRAGLPPHVPKLVGRCLACGYDLDGLALAADGCTVCPECGAAWKLPPAS